MSEQNGTLTANEATDVLSIMQQIYTMQDAISRASLARRIGTTHRGRRDLYQTLGYDERIDYEQAIARVHRNGLAFRIVNAFPRDTWRYAPFITEDPEQDYVERFDPAERTPFEAALDDVLWRHKAWFKMRQLDALACIGRYSVMMFGLRNDSQGTIGRPPRNQERSPDHLLYLSLFSEANAEIDTLVNDITDPRFGEVAFYKIDTSRNKSGTDRARRATSALPEFRVHASRVLHAAEHTLEDQIYGISKLQTIWNNLHDLDKILGGSAEQLWIAGSRAVFGTTQEGFAFNPNDDTLKNFKEQVEEWIHGFRNFILGQGINVQPMMASVADPRNHFDIQIDIIAGAHGIPKRFLIGSERGELASTQDVQNWLSNIMARQEEYITPCIVRGFIDKLIEFRIVPEPESDYFVRWRDLLALSDQETARIASDWGSAARSFAQAATTGASPVADQEAREFMGLPIERPVEEGIEVANDV